MTRQMRRASVGRGVVDNALFVPQTLELPRPKDALLICRVVYRPAASQRIALFARKMRRKPGTIITMKLFVRFSAFPLLLLLWCGAFAPSACADGLPARFEAAWNATLPDNSKGYGVMLVPEAENPSGAKTNLPYDWTEPNAPGMFGVGFDTFSPPTKSPFSADGNIYDRPQREVSLHLNGVEVANRFCPDRTFRQERPSNPASRRLGDRRGRGQRLDRQNAGLRQVFLCPMPLPTRRVSPKAARRLSANCPQNLAEVLPPKPPRRCVCRRFPMSSTITNTIKTQQVWFFRSTGSRSARYLHLDTGQNPGRA